MKEYIVAFIGVKGTEVSSATAYARTGFDTGAVEKRFVAKRRSELLHLTPMKG